MSTPGPRPVPTVPEDLESMRKTPAALWTATTSNRKTGNIPTAWIGKTRAESLSSCKGCPLLGAPGVPMLCYAQGGTPAMAHASMVRKVARVGVAAYALPQAMAKRWKGAKALRVGAIGEPGRLPVAWWRRTRAVADEAGLAVLAYTHRWRSRPALKGHSMASCDSLIEADVAVSKGWRVAVVLPADTPLTSRPRTPGGRPVTICPAIRWSDVTCNKCRQCDGSRPGAIIGFPMH